MKRCRGITLLILLTTLQCTSAQARWPNFVYKLFDVTPLGVLHDNFHTVQKKQCYRSKQLSASKLRTTIDENRIKTIINLRGSHPGTPWYDDEVAVLNEKGVRHINIGLSVDCMPTPQQVRELLDAFSSSPKPVLIHCKAGADRTGLAAALWKCEKMHMPLKQSFDQLSLRYGHVAKRSMDEFIKLWYELRAGSSTTEALEAYELLYEYQ